MKKQNDPAGDFSAFGVQLSGRTFTASSVSKKYRMGYQGSEMDNEVKNGEGNSYTTEFRQLDPRLGRWLSIDPKATAHPTQYRNKNVRISVKLLISRLDWKRVLQFK